MQLRDYQQKSIDMTYDFIRKNPGKNPCIVLSTGSGKSIICGKLCADAINIKTLVLAPSKELIEQNYEKIVACIDSPAPPVGIFSASLGLKMIDHITVASIQSIIKSADKLGVIDLVIVDECHLISHKQMGAYRKLIDILQSKNKKLVVIGLTATPFRLGHGYIHHGADTVFDHLIEPVSFTDLVAKGYLAPLRSKSTGYMIDTSKVKKRGGEFIEKELQATVDIDKNNERIAEIIVQKSGNTKHWLVFCTGVKHAEHMSIALNNLGIRSAYLHGGHSKKERELIISEFTSGKIAALCNCEILTTGFDFPDIDLVAMVRPTMSTVIYVQAAGRGTRTKSHTDHCIYLDFGGNIDRHGPITNLIPPRRGGNGDGEAPVKLCPQCSEILHLSCMLCPDCGYVFPQLNKLEKLRLSNADIMGDSLSEIEIKGWMWTKYTSRAGKNMIRCTYLPPYGVDPIYEYLPIFDVGPSGNMALGRLKMIAKSANVNLMDADNVDVLCKIMTKAQSPSVISYKINKGHKNVVARIW
jgi:DNA repair protein RadD